jgi:Ca-activated chloride channel family protein
LPFRSHQLAAVLFTMLALLSGGRAEAQRPDDCGRRECVTTPCRPMPCPMPARMDQMQRTAREVRVTLDGRVLRYEVTERWTNRGRTLGEVDYVLPLPRGAAFEDLALEIDGERVTGEALDATKARRVYEEIVRKQKDPALVEWMGLGVLRTRIFPVAPGETRTVVVRFRAVAEREGDALRVDVPAPRGRGTMASGTALTLSWPSGSAFGDAWSPTHRADVTRRGARRVATVEDATGTVTLLVPVRAADRAAISVLAHAPRAGDGYALITLTPPVTRRAATPRDLTFVVDVSGSMAGEKIAQAKAAGRQLLRSLAPGDRFRMIAFASDVQEFRDGWSTADANSRRAAERWLDELRASGGTNIAGALDRALEVREARDRLALVLFLTDGAPTVGERRADRLAARAAEQRGARRVFTFGLGEDVNAGLLEQVAIDGAGTAHFVRPEEDVERVVGVVAERLTSPVATDLRIRADGVTLHAVQPAGRLDLFAGQELTILARYRGDRTRGRVIITGQSADGPVTWTAQANFPERRSADAFVGRLWATQRVGWLSAERRKEGPSRELDAEIRDLGERWGIPTELTSYLVLEPQMVASPNSISPIGRPDTRVRAQGIGAASGNAAAPAAVRAEEFAQAKQAASMREMRSVADLDAAAPSATATTRRTSTRQFTLRDSVWVDTRAEAPQARTLRVRPFSAAYFAAMERLPELREAFALGERVAVHGRAVTVILAADGEETLGGTALAALTRDW